jgi:addiction module HigA family antidote
MIQSFRCKDAQALFATGKSRRFAAIAEVATCKLQQLDAATLEFPRSAPGNPLEALRGKRKGQYSIRINDQWRLCFTWMAAGPEQVEIVDYHWRGNIMVRNGTRPIHRGETLREDFPKPLGMSAHALAMALRVPAPRINDIVRERRSITPDTAMRLARYFGGEAQSWMNLQVAYDLRTAEIAEAKTIEREVLPRAAWSSTAPGGAGRLWQPVAGGMIMGGTRRDPWIPRRGVRRVRSRLAFSLVPRAVS